MSTIFCQIKVLLYKQFSFQYDQIQLETKLELELGMDSREMIEFLEECEKSFDIEINLDDIDKMMEYKQPLIIKDIVDYIEKSK